MKEDFINVRQELSHIGIIRVASDFYTEPKRKGSVFFVRSPQTRDKTASLALYPGSNRFCDFAAGNRSGDIIGFVAYVKDINQWEALKELQAFYGLSDSRERDKQEAQRRIQLQQERERKKAERKQAFYVALFGEIDRLKRWANIYRTAIEKRLYEPLNDDMWAHCMNELQKVDYQLDILCAADSKAYSRLKPYAENLSSDRFQWLLDCLDILKAQGVFEATEGELKELRAQRDCELIKQPGADRRCAVEW